MSTLRDPNRRPTHPGAVLREDVLPALGWTQDELATRLSISRFTLLAILNEKKAITAEVALSISCAVGGSPKSWLNIQGGLDIWEVTN